MFGLGQWHRPCQVAGRGAALEVDTLSDTASVEVLVRQHMIAVAHPLGLHFVDGLGTQRDVLLPGDC